MTEDPLLRFFEEAFSDPKNWEENPPQPAIEERLIDPDDEPEEIVELRLSSQKVNQPTTRRPESRR
jgi:hypothetical protein